MDSKAIVRRFYEEVVNHGNTAAADELLSADLLDHGVPAGFPHGRVGFLQFATSLKAAFPDLRVTIEDLIAEGDQVAARVSVQGTHTGMLFGRLRLAGGKVVERWNVRDLLSLLQQLGVDVGI